MIGTTKERDLKGRASRRRGEVAGEENRRFLASARSRFFMEPFQFERVDAFGLNVGGMKLEKKEPGNV